jgi:predicted cupin superfamily sugar epimerase
VHEDVASGPLGPRAGSLRADELIALLHLHPHPEGGYYREIHRSAVQVRRIDDRDARCGLTAIYFLLAGGGVSRWHRVRSDEVWHHCEGDPLDLSLADPDFMQVTTGIVGPLGEDAAPVRVVRAGQWQTARSRGAYTLVACTVGPGFDFADFQMLRDVPDVARTVARRHPSVAAFI